MTRMKIRALAISSLILFGVGALLSAQTSARYPGSAPLKSPDRKYSILNVDDWTREEPKHHLYLVNAQTLKKTLLFEYGRSAEVFWCPSSSFVVINDFAGSNVSSVYLVDIDVERKNLALDDLLLQWMKNHGQEEIASSCDHIYAYASGITPQGDIKLVLTGYNGLNPKGFTRKFLYAKSGELSLTKTSDKFTGLK